MATAVEMEKRKSAKRLEFVCGRWPKAISFSFLPSHWPMVIEPVDGKKRRKRNVHIIFLLQILWQPRKSSII